MISGLVDLMKHLSYSLPIALRVKIALLVLWQHPVLFIIKIKGICRIKENYRTIVVEGTVTSVFSPFCDRLAADTQSS
jgi:hypothetical protein